MGRGCARKSFFQKTLEVRRGAFRLNRRCARPGPATDRRGRGTGGRGLAGALGRGRGGTPGDGAGRATGGCGERTQRRACAERRDAGGGEGGAISRQPAPRGGGLARDSLGRIFWRVGDRGRSERSEVRSGRRTGRGKGRGECGRTGETRGRRSVARSGARIRAKTAVDIWEGLGSYSYSVHCCRRERQGVGERVS